MVTTILAIILLALGVFLVFGLSGDRKDPNTGEVMSRGSQITGIVVGIALVLTGLGLLMPGRALALWSRLRAVPDLGAVLGGLGILVFIVGLLGLLLAIIPPLRRRFPHWLRNAQLLSWLGVVVIAGSFFFDTGTTSANEASPQELVFAEAEEITTAKAPEAEHPAAVTESAPSEPAAVTPSKPTEEPAAPEEEPEPQTYPLSFALTPEDALVKIYQEGSSSILTGESGPLAEFELPAGDYDYEVFGTEYETYEGSFSIPKNKNLAVSLTPALIKTIRGMLAGRLEPTTSGTLSAEENRAALDVDSWYDAPERLQAGSIDIFHLASNPNEWRIQIFEASLSPEEYFGVSNKRLVQSSGVTETYRVTSALGGVLLSEVDVAGDNTLNLYTAGYIKQREPDLAWLLESQYPTTVSDGELITACKEFVKQNLIAPSTARFPGFFALLDARITTSNNGDKLWKGWVDAENAFGAMLRYNFDCTYSKATDYVSVDFY